MRDFPLHIGGCSHGFSFLCKIGPFPFFMRSPRYQSSAAFILCSRQLLLASSFCLWYRWLSARRHPPVHPYIIRRFTPLPRGSYVQLFCFCCCFCFGKGARKGRGMGKRKIDTIYVIHAASLERNVPLLLPRLLFGFVSGRSAWDFFSVGFIRMG